MVVIDTQKLQVAVHFFNVGKECYEKLIRNISEENILLISPAIVNLSFSIELFLKSILAYPEKVHFLDDLLHKVPGNEQDTIIQLTIRQYEVFSKTKISEQDFWNELGKVKNAFVDWRYCYEKSVSINPSFLLALASSLNSILTMIVRLNNQ